MANTKTKKVGFAVIASIASLWFSTHAGGGFASGNQATQYFVQYGWTSLFAPLLTFVLLAFCYRQVIVMCNNHSFNNYKELFSELWNPFPKLELLFEVYFFVMLICAVGAAIAGAAELLTEMVGVPYVLAIIIVSVILLLLSIFGPTLLVRAATVMTVVILVCCFTIYFTGIAAKGDVIANTISNFQNSSADGFVDHGWFQIVISIITYAGFQCGVVPALASCGTALKTRRNATIGMIVGGIINALALTLSCLMLLGWYGDVKGSQIPMLDACNMMGGGALTWAYAISLFLCFISTGVSLIYGLVPRFENIKPLLKVKDVHMRRSIICILGMVVPALFSLVGLTNVVKYGYQFAGVLGFAVLLLPIMTIGTYKNWKFSKEHPKGGNMEMEYKQAIGEQTE